MNPVVGLIYVYVYVNMKVSQRFLHSNEKHALFKNDPKKAQKLICTFARKWDVNLNYAKKYLFHQSTLTKK